MPDPRPGAIFDVDGTLLDNNYLHTVAWWRAFRAAEIDVPMAAIHRAVGMGSTGLMAKLIGEDREALNEANSREFSRFHSEMRALPGAAELLREIRGMGLAVVLGTSAKPEDLGAMRRTLDADDAIDDIVSSADVPRAKPDPDIFQFALANCGLDPDRTMVVGDTGWDVEAARRAGLACICMMTGGWSRQELEEAGAVAVYQSPADLLDRLAESPLSRLAG
jgi:HAD superfamily hydrolase (TIGR01509 family)